MRSKNHPTIAFITTIVHALLAATYHRMSVNPEMVDTDSAMIASGSTKRASRLIWKERPFPKRLFSIVDRWAQLETFKDSFTAPPPPRVQRINTHGLSREEHQEIADGKLIVEGEGKETASVAGTLRFSAEGFGEAVKSGKIG